MSSHNDHPDRTPASLADAAPGQAEIDHERTSRSARYPYAGVASEHRRGLFFGRGPKGYRRSDGRLYEEICDRLTTHPDIDASDIDVIVDNGVATLAGSVEDRHEKRLAEYIAEDVVGVDDVDSQLKVRRGLWAAIAGERATDREPAPRARPEPDTMASETSRAISARNAARRDSEAR